MFVWSFSSHLRIIHSFGDVTIAVEGLQIFTYARHLWPLSSEVLLACHTYCDTEHPFMRDIHTWCGWDSNTQPSACGANALTHCATAAGKDSNVTENIHTFTMNSSVSIGTRTVETRSRHMACAVVQAWWRGTGISKDRKFTSYPAKRKRTWAGKTVDIHFTCSTILTRWTEAMVSSYRRKQ